MSASKVNKPGKEKGNKVQAHNGKTDAVPGKNQVNINLIINQSIDSGSFRLFFFNGNGQMLFAGNFLAPLRSLQKMAGSR